MYRGTYFKKSHMWLKTEEDVKILDATLKASKSLQIAFDVDHSFVY